MRQEIRDQSLSVELKVKSEKSEVQRFKASIFSLLTSVVLPLIFFLFLTFIFNPTIFTGFNSQIERNDGRFIAWTLAWDNHILLTNPSEFFHANIFYPNSNTLTYSEHLFGTSLLSLPVYILTGGSPVASFNFLMILGYTLNAFFAYILVRFLTRSPVSGLVAGIIYGYCSYKIWNFGHLQNIIIFYFPLLLYFIFKYFEILNGKAHKKLWYLAGIGICLLMQSLSSWYHMIFIFLLFGIFMLYFFYKRQISKKDILRFGIMLGAIALILLPFAIPYFQFNKENQSAFTITDIKEFSASIEGYLFPPATTLIGGKLLPYLNIKFEHVQENVNFIGYIALILSLIAVFSVKKIKSGAAITINKSKLVFVAGILIFGILSLGPFLWLYDHVTRIPLPYLIIYYVLPPIRFLRTVSRYSTVVFLLIAILSGFGFKILYYKLKPRKLNIIFAIAVMLLIILEYFPFFSIPNFENVEKVPSIYYSIRDNDDIKALAELPIDVKSFNNTKYVYYAGIHFKPLVNGYSGFEPKDYGLNRDIIALFPSQLAIARLAQMGATHVLLNPEFTAEIISPDVEFIEENDGYRLYKINQDASKAKIYFDNFTTLKYSSGFEKVTYEFINTRTVNANSKAIIFDHVAPIDEKSVGQFNINSDNMIARLRIKFRAETINDNIVIDCGNENKYSFSNIEFNDELVCNSRIIKISMNSSNINGTMLKAIGFVSN